MLDLLLTLAEASPSTDEMQAALIERAQRDPAEFAAIYRQYVDRVFYYVLAKSNCRGDAEDITAQVFLDALESLPAYRHRGHFAAWLFTIARHRLADFYRRRGPERLGPDPGGLDPESTPPQAEDPLAQIIQSERLQRLARLLARLDDDERELLRLRFAAGLGFAEMAVLQRRRESAVKMSFYRLLASLKGQMEAGDA